MLLRARRLRSVAPGQLEETTSVLTSSWLVPRVVFVLEHTAQLFRIRGDDKMYETTNFIKVAKLKYESQHK